MRVRRRFAMHYSSLLLATLLSVAKSTIVPSICDCRSHSLDLQEFPVTSLQTAEKRQQEWIGSEQIKLEEGMNLRGGFGDSEFLRGGNGEIDFSGGGTGGRIEMILGPMFAGKSTELMRRIRRHRLANRKCLLIKYSKDVRHGEGRDELSTHDNYRLNAVPTQVLCDVKDGVEDAEVIGIDEAQFYPDLVPFCEEAAAKGKIVILAALDATFRREPFGAVCELVARAEYVTKLSAVCKLCRREASFTRRTTEETALEAIGGAEMYMPTCRRCFQLPLPAGTAAQA